MPRYLISFDDGSMDHIPEADQPAVGESAHVGSGDRGRSGLNLRWRGPTPTIEHCGERRDGGARRRSCGQLGSLRRVDVRKRSARSALIWSPDHAQRQSACEA